MQELLQLIQANIQYAHFIIFATLLLAGLREMERNNHPNEVSLCLNNL